MSEIQPNIRVAGGYLQRAPSEDESPREMSFVNLLMARCISDPFTGEVNIQSAKKVDIISATARSPSKLAEDVRKALQLRIDRRQMKSKRQGTSSSNKHLQASFEDFLAELNAPMSFKKISAALATSLYYQRNALVRKAYIFALVEKDAPSKFLIRSKFLPQILSPLKGTRVLELDVLTNSEAQLLLNFMLLVSEK